jgi:molybdate transport system permease protein
MIWVGLVATAAMVLLIMAALLSMLFQIPPAVLVATLCAGETLFALRLTFLTSAAATLLSALLGVPSGYLLARKMFPGQVVVDTLIDLPLTMTPLVAGVGLLFLLGNEWVGRGLASIGLQVLFSPAGAVLAQTFIAAPIMTRTAKAAFASVDRRLEQAAQTLGLAPYGIFWRVSLPLARPILISGLVLTWARAGGEFGATLMVAGATRLRTETLPIAVYLNLSSGELGIALACAWLLIMAGFIALTLLKSIGYPPAMSTETA